MMTWLLAVLVLLTRGSETESKLTITIQPNEPVGLVEPLEIKCTYESAQDLGYKPYDMKMLNESKLTITVEPKEPVALVEPLEIKCTFQSAQDLGYKPYDMQILNGQYTVLATISRGNAPEVKNDKDRLTVEGQLVSGKSDAYLKAAWKRSASNLSGNYTCLAHARNDASQKTLFITHQNVTVKKPQLEGVLTYLQEKATADDIAQRKNEKEMDSLRRALAVSANQIRNLTATQNLMKLHIEEGSVECGHSNSFTENVAKEKRVPVVFKTPYGDAPSVILELRLIDFNQRYGSRLYVNARDVTAMGFTVVCGTWADTIIHGVNVYWHTVNT